MTVREFRQRAILSLDFLGRAQAVQEADWMLRQFCGLDAARLLTALDEPLDERVLDSLLRALERRKAGQPLQYILGEWEFYGLTFRCGEGCLIPRPETEALVSHARNALPQGGTFLDLCTGSGCIAIALAACRSDVTGVGVDLSDAALRYARQNAKLHGVTQRVTFVMEDLAVFTPDAPVDALLSNPPYIKTSDLSSLPRELSFEPVIALDGGPDGLFYYRLILDRFADAWLKPQGLLLLEAGDDTVQDVSSLLIERGFAVSIKKDLFGRDRICAAVKRA